MGGALFHYFAAYQFGDYFFTSYRVPQSSVGAEKFDFTRQDMAPIPEAIAFRFELVILRSEGLRS